MSPAQAVIAAMITPALLILASASLIAVVLARLARVVDRIRKLREISRAEWIAGEVDRHERRAALAQRALVFLFLAITCVVTGGFTIALDRWFGEALWWVPVALTGAGMALIVAGCWAMIAETRLSVAQVDDEIALLRRT